VTVAPLIAVWLGSAPPVRSIRWLDGALKAASRFGGATAVAAGHSTWLDLAADRALRHGLAAVGVVTDLQLDYLGWAQIMAGVARQLGATTILVDEASRPERFAEVAALAELCDAAQLTHVVALAPDAATIHASRIAGSELQTVRIHGPAVIGVRIAGPAIDEYPTPMPSVSMRRCDLAELGLDPAVLGHRSLPPRAGQEPRRTVERVAEHLAVHMAPRSEPPAAAPPGKLAAGSGASRAASPGGARGSPGQPGSPGRERRDSRGPRKGPKGTKGNKGAKGVQGE
jgi:electron transfer flavoprotein alpha/beta subunit